MLSATLLGSLPFPGASSQEARNTTLSLADLRQITGVELPPATSRLAVHVTFPPDHPYIVGGKTMTAMTAVVGPGGALHVAGLDSKAVTSTQAEDANPACRDRTYKRDGAKWTRRRMPIRWKWGRGMPNNLSRRKTGRSLRRAHHSWAKLRSNCRHDLHTYLRFRYKGRSGRSPGRDGVNLVDFGRLGSGALGVTYTWFQNGRMLESDLRLNSGYRWTNRRRARSFRVGNVAVHEIGHQLGLGHVGSGHNALTMYSIAYPGEVKKLTLGRGDLRGIANLYGSG